MKAQAQGKFRCQGAWQREQNPSEGELLDFDDKQYIYFDGYWIRYYAPPPDTLANRKRLIDHLTRRAFHHTEPGIATPGHRLDMARESHHSQSDPALKRVNAAMLAGALFNRATDVFTAIVELEEKGVKVSRENELMKTCSDCFSEALELGTQVKHHSGEEGIDELWGEPFRAFTLPMDEYYRSRYIKVAQTMSNIDQIADTIRETFHERPEFTKLEGYLENYATAAKLESETMKSDQNIFQIWPQFIAAGEALSGFQPAIQPGTTRKCLYVLEHAQKTLVSGTGLINWVARARVPMPKSTTNYVENCKSLKARLDAC